MKSLFAVVGVFEMLVGLGFVIMPSPPAKLCFGASLDGAGETNMARVLGVLLLALGFAFWRARNDVRAPSGHGLALAMLAYNTAIALLLVTSAVSSHISAPALWPAFCIHTALATWCGWSLRTGAALERKVTLDKDLDR